jgi:hypothetical protein
MCLRRKPPPASPAITAVAREVVALIQRIDAMLEQRANSVVTRPVTAT